MIKKITSNHYWFKNQHLEIDSNGKRSWFKNGKLIDNCIGPRKDIELSFSLTGIYPLSLTCQNMTIEELYQNIYQTIIPENIELYHKLYNYSNHGYSINYIGSEKFEAKTYEVLFKELGRKIICPKTNITYYEYPDSVYLNIEEEDNKLGFYYAR